MRYYSSKSVIKCEQNEKREFEYQFLHSVKSIAVKKRIMLSILF